MRRQNIVKALFTKPQDSTHVFWKTRKACAIVVCVFLTGAPTAQLIVPKELPPSALTSTSPEVVVRPGSDASSGMQSEAVLSENTEKTTAPFISEGYFLIGFSSRELASAAAESQERNELYRLQSQVLFSSEWSNLAPGLYIVVYGSYSEESEARAVLHEIRKWIPDAYVKLSGAKHPQAQPTFEFSVGLDRGTAIGGASKGPLAGWIRAVQRRVEAVYVQPSDILGVSNLLQAEVAFWVDKNGLLLGDPELVLPANDRARALGEAGKRAIKLAAPFPLLPEAYPWMEQRVVYVFTVTR